MTGRGPSFFTSLALAIHHPARDTPCRRGLAETAPAGSGNHRIRFIVDIRGRDCIRGFIESSTCPCLRSGNLTRHITYIDFPARVITQGCSKLGNIIEMHNVDCRQTERRSPPAVHTRLGRSPLKARLQSSAKSPRSASLHRVQQLPAEDDPGMALVAIPIHPFSLKRYRVENGLSRSHESCGYLCKTTP